MCRETDASVDGAGLDGSLERDSLEQSVSSKGHQFFCFFEEEKKAKGGINMCRQSNYRLDVRASTQKCKRMLYIYFFSYLLLLLPFCVVSFKDNRTRCIGECCGGQLLLPPSLSPAVSLPDCSCRSPSAPVFLLPTRLAPRPPWRHHIREKQRPAEKPPLLLHIHTQTWTNKTSVCAHGAKSAQVS